MIQAEFGTDALVSFEYHISGFFATGETSARGSWYGVSGVPVVRIDGKYVVNGATTCEESASDYRDLVNARMNETESISPVEITGSYVPLQSGIPISATFRLLDAATLTDLRATLLIYEDNIIYDGKSWQHVVRDLVDESIVLTDVGDEVTVSSDIPIDPSWNLEELHAVAYLQKTSGDKEIIQGARLPFGDFTFLLDDPLESIPAGNGSAVFDALLTNLGETSDLFTLEFTEPFGDWYSEFFVCGDSAPHTGTFELELGPSESCPIQLRVETNDSREIRSGGFRVTSANSTRSVEESIVIYNHDYATLLVDDDWSEAHEVPIRTALDAIGVLHESWDVYYEHGQDGPGLAEISAYDRVIWHTGFHLGTYLLNNFDVEALTHYLDSGGQVFFSSQHYLNTIDTETPFAHDYLGLESWSLDTAYDRLDGVEGDPIGDGLSLTLDFNIPFFNQGDNATPGPGVTPVLIAPDGSVGMVRNEMEGGGRIVFMPAALHAVDDGQTDPSNLRGLLGRVLSWLEPGVPAGVADGRLPAGLSRITRVSPNPSKGGFDLSISLSKLAASGGISLELLDPTGRRIASLSDLSTEPGMQSVAWTGAEGLTRSLPNGLYFIRLTTIEGSSAEKILILR